MPTSEPCERCFVNYRAQSELLCPEILPGRGRGAQAPQCHLVMSSAGGLPGAGAAVTGPLANLVFAKAVCACVVFLLLNRKRDLIGHLYCWTHIGVL